MRKPDCIPAGFEIYQILAELRGRSCVPPGIAGRLHRVLDDMRFEKAPCGDIRAVEELSLLLHRQRLGLLGEAEYGSHILGMAERWLAKPMPVKSLACEQTRSHPWLARTRLQHRSEPDRA